MTGNVMGDTQEKASFDTRRLLRAAECLAEEVDQQWAEARAELSRLRAQLAAVRRAIEHRPTTVAEMRTALDAIAEAVLF